MHRIEFARRQAFLLEDSNLQRMLGIIHASFGQNTYGLSFSVDLKSGKRLNFDSVDDLLRHDNTVADPIRDLQIRALNRDIGSSCLISFDGDAGAHATSVLVRVESEEQRWATSLSAELEEQVERIKMPGLFYQLRKASSRSGLRFYQFWMLLVSCLFTVFLIVVESPRISNVQEERIELLRRAETAKTSDEKIDVLLRAQTAELRSALEMSDLPTLKFPSVSAKHAIGILPILFSLALLWYLFKYCYPFAVFSWGDSGKHFLSLLERRKSIWSILFTVMALGILVNVSSPVISHWLGI